MRRRGVCGNPQPATRLPTGSRHPLDDRFTGRSVVLDEEGTQPVECLPKLGVVVGARERADGNRVGGNRVGGNRVDGNAVGGACGSKAAQESVGAVGLLVLAPTHDGLALAHDGLRTEGQPGRHTGDRQLMAAEDSMPSADVHANEFAINVRDLGVGDDHEVRAAGPSEGLPTTGSGWGWSAA